MSGQSPTPRSPLEARALWERATEIERDRAASGQSRAPLHRPEELSVEGLLEVGREVGLAPDSVLLSAAEGRLADAADLKPRRASPLWHRVLVETRDALEASVHLPVTPAEALRILDDVMGREEYRMALEDRIGEDPEQPSVSVFRNVWTEGLSREAAFHAALRYADGRVLIVAVIPDRKGGTRLRIRMPLYERGVNLTLSGVAGAGVGASGASLGTAVGQVAVGAALGGATGVLPLAVVVAPAGVGGYVGLGAGILGFRRLQRWGFRRGQFALSQLVRALELEAQEGSPEGEVAP